MNECLTRSAEAAAHPHEQEREHYGLAISCAKRFYGRGVPREELIGEAEAALLWAASRFDASRGVRFSTYAIPFVLGALRELCRRETPMHVPRCESRLLAAADTARERLGTTLGREPTIAELALAVDVTPQRLCEMLAARDRMRTVDPMPDERDMAACESGFEDAVLLKDMIFHLPSPYAQVIWLRHALGWSQQEIAARFHVGQPQVSRWLKRGLSALAECRSSG